jgi:hypothetical protein
MADHDDQLAHMTQPQPNQDEWTGPRSSPPQIPRHPKEPRNQEPRREGHSQHGNSQFDHQDPRQDENVAVPFNPLVIKWQYPQGR